MGSESSTAKAPDRGKHLGDEILQIIISELLSAMTNSKETSGREKTAYEKRVRDTTILQEKFADYRKLVEEAKDKQLEEATSTILKLQTSLEEYKQKINKVEKEKQELETNSYNKKIDQERIIRDLTDKYNKTEKSLSTESELRKSLEKDVTQMKTFKGELEAQTRKTRELERELDNTRGKLLDEIKLKLELETKLRLEDTSTDETVKVLRATIDEQSAIIKNLQETSKGTQQILANELAHQPEYRIKYEIEKQACLTLRKEKQILLSKIRTFEADVSQMKTLKGEFEAQTNKVRELNRELNHTGRKLLVETNLKLELEQKLKETDKTMRVLRDTIDKQSAAMKQFQETLKGTQQRLEDELTNKEESKIKLEVGQQALAILRKEKECLLSNLTTMEEEWAKSKLKREEQEKRLKEASEQLCAVQKINRLQVKLKKKAQAELSVLAEKSSTIKQLEAKLEEKDRIITQHSKGAQQKPQEELDELHMEPELSTFLKMSEETRAKEVQLKELELNGVKATYESKLREQLERFNRIVYRLKMTEKKRDQHALLQKKTEGKLNLLEMSFTSMKAFCEKELRERKDFLEEFKKKEIRGGLAGASTSEEPESLMAEKMAVEAQLDAKINEIALLKQQMKQKENEMQNMAAEGHSNNKRNEMAKLHEEFMENLKKFNQNQED